nr:immunoglobulin heavy chain junction region [Mus musculus]
CARDDYDNYFDYW